MNESRDQKIERAARRFKLFTGHDANQIETRELKVPDVALIVGDCLDIGYMTVRDGRIERYRHTFAAKSRPQLAASHDGSVLILLGGAFQFTARGIVDRRR